MENVIRFFCRPFPAGEEQVAVSDTIVWISGATEGVGLGLARTVPYPGARVINLSRRQRRATPISVTLATAPPRPRWKCGCAWSSVN